MGEESERAALVNLSDPALVQACLAGDQRAWEELVDRYGRLVYSISRRMGFTAADADDIFQEVFSALLRSLPVLRDQTRLAAWLITTTRRECWRFGQSAARWKPLDEAAFDDAPAPLDEIVRWEHEQGVRQAMRRLDARCRELLRELFLEPAAPSYETIAARLHMPIGSIGPTRARCFKKLGVILHDLGFNGAL